MKTTRYLDICTIDGKVLFSFCITEREGNEPFPDQPSKPGREQNDQDQTNGREKKNTNGSSEEKITDPQQRKLFRILAEQGLDGEKAHKELLKRFKVSDLTDIGKFEASRMIDSMLKAQNGGN
jgi:hypothetical protein